MRLRSRVFVPVLLVVGAAGLVVAARSIQAQKKGSVPFPTSYRHWTVVKTMVIYVNDSGLASVKQEKAYPDGTVFVFDLFDIHSAQGAIETRGRKFVAVMKKKRQAQSLNRRLGLGGLSGRRTEGFPAGPKTMLRLP